MLETELYTEGVTVVLEISVAPLPEAVPVVAQHGKAAMVDKGPTPDLEVGVGVAVLLVLLELASQGVLPVPVLGEATVAVLVDQVMVQAAFPQPLSLREILVSMAVVAKAVASRAAFRMAALAALILYLVLAI
jgi:hypothetical protein